MAQVLVTESYLEDIGRALRSKTGTTTAYKPSQMAAAVRSIKDPSTLVEKSVTANGTYNASSDNADGYSSVAVNVPNTYSDADEGKVLVDGALAEQTSTTKTANGTYDTTTNDEVVVNVEPNLGAKTITENGTYAASDDEVDGFSSVTVRVSGGGGASGYFWEVNYHDIDGVELLNTEYVQDGNDAEWGAAYSWAATPNGDPVSGILESVIANLDIYGDGPAFASLAYQSDAAGVTTWQVATDGIYLVVVESNSTHSITLPASATELYTKELIAKDLKGVIVKIVRLEAGDEVELRTDLSSSWPGRVKCALRLLGASLLVEVNATCQSDGNISYTLPQDNNKYVVFAFGAGRAEGDNFYYDRTSGGGEELILHGTWGLNSISRLSICDGNKSPTYSFRGYDGGMAAIFAWRIA